MSRIWRFTPDIAANDSAARFIVRTTPSLRLQVVNNQSITTIDFSISAKVVASPLPANGRELPSKLGLWIRENHVGNPLPKRTLCQHAGGKCKLQRWPSPSLKADDGVGSTVLFGPMGFNGRVDWPVSFTNLMFDLHYQPFGYGGNDTAAGAMDFYNVTTSLSSSFATAQNGSNLLRCDVVFWNWIGPDSRNCGVTAADNRGLCKDWRQRWQLVHTALQPWISNGTFVGVNFGDELIGSGVHLADLTAAVNLVRETWPEAILYYNEDFSVMVSGYTGLDFKIQPVGAGTEWAMPAELDLFSIDEYCGFDHCTPEGSPPHPCELDGPGSGPAYNYSYDPACAKHLRRYYETLIYPRLGPRTKVLIVPGAFAPAKGAHSAKCPYSLGPGCPNPLNASLVVYDAFWAKHATELWSWAQDDPRLVGIAPFHFDDSVSYPAELVTGFRNMPETLKAWTEIGRQIVANANRSFANAGVAASWHEVLREMPAVAAK